jgi:membrane protein
VSSEQPLSQPGKTGFAEIKSFLVELYERAWRHDVFFLASGLAFNVFICLIPFLALFLLAAGAWFDLTQIMKFIEICFRVVFPGEPDSATLREGIAEILTELMSRRSSLGIFTLIGLLVTSTYLFSSLRSVLNRVFNYESQTHFLITYFMDVVLVFSAAILVALTIVVRSLVEFAKNSSRFADFLNRHEIAGMLDFAASNVSVPLFFALCCLIYKFVPTEKVPVKVALLASATTTVVWEISSRIFAWYLGTYTPFSKIYGASAFFVVSIIWLYYSSLILILGAEVGRLYWDRLPKEAKKNQ